MGQVTRSLSRYVEICMGNGLRDTRIKAGMSLQDAASALGLSKSGYRKKERSERGLSHDFIRRACDLFGVSPEEISGEIGGIPFTQEIDPIKLEELVALARSRLGALPLEEAKELIRSLISASRTPRPGRQDRNN